MRDKVAVVVTSRDLAEALVFVSPFAPLIGVLTIDWESGVLKGSWSGSGAGTSAYKVGQACLAG